MQMSHNRWLMATAICGAVVIQLVLSGFVTAAEQNEKKPAREETWNVIYLSGHRIGYGQSVVENLQQDGVAIVRTSAKVHMRLKRFDQTLVINQLQMTEETAAGELRMFRLEETNPPAKPKITSGVVEGNQLTLTTEVNGKATKVTRPWKKEVKSPTYQDRLIKDNPMKPGEIRTFDVFFPEFAQVGKVTLKGQQYEDTKLLDNTTQKLFKVSCTHTLMPGVPTDSYLDKDGETVKVSTSVLGSAMESFLVSQTEALKVIQGAELDLSLSTVVKVQPILKVHDTKRAVYRITITGQDPSLIIPAGDTQSIKKLDKETAELTVVSLPIPATAKVGQVAGEFLESSQYLQRDDERVKRHANQAAGDATDPAEIARRMEKYVQRKLDRKNFSTAMASAAEVAQSLEGDCTEHSVLLAAMLRAKGIPSRVAVGMVYSDQLFAFVGHMWTEVSLDGKWIPLDATLGHGGIGAIHIKLADSSLTDNGPPALSSFLPLMQVIGKLKIDVVKSE
ncbi:transglutaminase-like domain-containing protein [Schlesneria paludicola]|uniref:transglutaminase-like domain-containing protein n=1 Tax=Schlesneria paludicola TaxID=360056 RepID=UPI00029AFD53|nr:transglutaminase-like domain-containing protein [Schlesneria paludicola]